MSSVARWSCQEWKGQMPGQQNRGDCLTHPPRGTFLKVAPGTLAFWSTVQQPLCKESLVTENTAMDCPSNGVLL